MPSNRFSLTDAFGPANEHVARINRICKETRARNQEALQESTLSIREAAIPNAISRPRDIPDSTGEPEAPCPSALNGGAPHNLTVIEGGCDD